MQTRTTLKTVYLVIILSTLTCFSAYASTISRLTTFVDGQVLFAGDLNGELNQLVNTVNLLDNSNLSSSANISPSKLSAAIAGAAINRDAISGILSVNVDGSTIVIAGNALSVVAGGIGPTQLAANSVTTAAIADGAVTTAKLPDGAVTTAKIADVNVTTSKIADSAVITSKIATAAVTQAKLEIRSTGTTVGAGGFAASNGIASFSTSNPSAFVPVTNLSVTITTLGNPIEIALQADGTGNPSTIISAGLPGNAPGFDHVAIFRGSTLAADHELGSSSTAITLEYPVELSYRDIEPAGTYTYTVQVKAAAAHSVSITAAVLTAHEL